MSLQSKKKQVEKFDRGFSGRFSYTN